MSRPASAGRHDPLRRGSPADTPEPRASEQVLDVPDASLLDLLDRVLNKGVMANGDLTLGVAGVDLIYVRLAAILCAADRVLSDQPEAGRKRRRTRPSRSRR